MFAATSSVALSSRVAIQKALAPQARIPAARFRSSTKVVANVEVGDKAPDFVLPDQNGKSFKLSSKRGKVVLFFYPADNTPGCTKEVCAFRDNYDVFKKAGATVVGISSDSIESHEGFADKYELPYTLLSDEGDEVRKLYGIPADLFGLIKGRQTYVIDKGVVKMVFNSQLKFDQHVEEAIAEIEKEDETKGGGNPFAQFFGR